MSERTPWHYDPGPAKDSRWTHEVNGIRHTVRVMATVEGYVVLRHMGCTPFLVHLSDFNQGYKPREIVAQPLKRRKELGKCP